MIYRSFSRRLLSGALMIGSTITIKGNLLAFSSQAFLCFFELSPTRKSSIHPLMVQRKLEIFLGSHVST